MKIAILLCGHLRSFRQTHASFEQLRSVLAEQGQVDVFCHTWDIEESVTASWWKENENTIPPANVKEEDIRRLYSPVKMLVEPSKQFDEIPLSILSIIPVSGILSMLYSQYRVFQLMEAWGKENNTRYDIIIKARYDLGYEMADHFAGLTEKALEEKCIYLPNTNPYELTGAFADVFALGEGEQMNAYCRFYEKFPAILKIYETAGYRELVPELCLRTYLDAFGVRYAPLDGIRVHILRSNGNKFRICSDRHFENNEPLCFFTDAIQKNKDVLPDGNTLMAANTRVLVFKYLGWIDDKLTTGDLEEYYNFYSGQWIPGRKIQRLALLARKDKKLSPAVMKNFFEEAIRKARYAVGKKLLLAFVLYRYGGYGTFYFRVIKKMITKK